jgi:hypothetical protein
MHHLFHHYFSQPIDQSVDAGQMLGHREGSDSEKNAAQ